MQQISNIGWKFVGFGAASHLAYIEVLITNLIYGVYELFQYSKSHSLFVWIVLGFGAAWHLAYIEVEELTSKKVWKFHCDNWLSKSDGDKQILRELTCGSTARPTTPGSKERTSKNCLLI